MLDLIFIALEVCEALGDKEADAQRQREKREADDVDMP